MISGGPKTLRLQSVCTPVSVCVCEGECEGECECESVRVSE